MAPFWWKWVLTLLHKINLEHDVIRIQQQINLYIPRKNFLSVKMSKSKEQNLPCNAPNIINSSNTHPFKWDDLIDFLLVWLLHVGADCCFRLLLLGFRWSFIHWSFLCNLLPCFRAFFFALLGTSGERETTHRLNLGSICYVDITLNYNSPLSWHRWTMLNMAT